MPRKRDTSWIQDYFFLIVPQPFEDELLSSWLTRVAIEHKRKLSIFLSLYVKKVHISELPDSDAGVVPDTFAMRFSRV